MVKESVPLVPALFLLPYPVIVLQLRKRSFRSG
nr:MAG TPA: hypothetical protein [Microviridae sp.]